MIIKEYSGGRGENSRKYYAMVATYGKRGIVMENGEFLSRGRSVFSTWEGARGFSHAYPEPPRFRHEKRKGGPPRDFNTFSGFWLVSGRMKGVLEVIDSDAFEFVRCDFHAFDGMISPDFWLCDVVRVMDALDESASDVQIIVRDGRKIYNLMGSVCLIFRSDIVGNARVFRMEYSQDSIFCDEFMRTACKQAGVTGVQFEPAAGIQRQCI